MGTSKSSNGPGSGVPFDPPWLDDIISQLDDIYPKLVEEQVQEKPEAQGFLQIQLDEIAPPRRFANARRALGDFVRTGDSGSMRKAIGHYSKTGLGGANNSVKRLRYSSTIAANTVEFLQSVRDKDNPKVNGWIDSILEISSETDFIADEIIRKIIPSGGSQDESASQESMSQAISDLLSVTPEVNLLILNDDSIWFLIESYLAYESFHRIMLDIGQVFENLSIRPLDKILRMNEMKSYLQSELHAQIDQVRSNQSISDIKELQSLLDRAIRNTFVVYEGGI